MSTEVLLEALGKSFDEFKSTNDQRLTDIEKRNGTAELEEKLAKQDAAISNAEKELKELNAVKAANDEMAKRIEAMELKQGRPGKANGQPAEDNEYKDAFLGGFMRKGNESGLDVKSGQTLVDADGGYAVPDGMDQNILKLLHDQSPMRRLATVMTVGQARYSQLVADGKAIAGWVGEVAPRPETQNPTLAKFNPNFGELYANPAATQTVLDDAFFNVESWYNEEVAMAFAEQEGTAFVSGDGVDKPMGLIAYPTAATADSTRPYGTIEHVETDLAGTIGADDLISLVYKLKAGYRQGANFMLNGESLTEVRKLKDANGNYLWQPSLTLGQPSTLLGYAVEEDESLPQVASGALSLVFGDIRRAYKILDVRGIRTLRDPYTNKPYVHFYTIKRVGGGVANTQAVKLLKIQ